MAPERNPRGQESLRRAFKYGLLITVGIASWVMFKHFVVKYAAPPWVDAVIFNAFELGGLALAIQEQHMRAGGLTFGQGMKTGLSTSAVYAVAACLFFAALYLFVGPALLQQAQEKGVGTLSNSAVLARAFAALFIGAMASGLVFSLLLSAIMRRSIVQPRA